MVKSSRLQKVKGTRTNVKWRVVAMDERTREDEKGRGRRRKKRSQRAKTQTRTKKENGQTAGD